MKEMIKSLGVCCANHMASSLTGGSMKLTVILETDWKDETNGETIAEVLRVLDRKNSWPREGAEQVTWAAPLVAESNGSSVTCEKSIIRILIIVLRANALFSRCDIS